MRAITALFFLFCFLVPSALAQLRVGFYQSSCPLAEKIVNSVVSNEFLRSRNNPNITAALLRMQFHDCFVNGCDASLLIDSTPERPSEKSAKPNASLRDFEIIDRIKESIERACPGIVSCADILTLATRDAVALAGGPGFSVLTGRRDGLRSNPSDVIDNLSRPTISVAESIKLFGAKGLGVEDMTALIGGGHSVGFTHCSQFKDRLNDPEMNPVLKARLRNTCSASDDPTVFLDQSTPFLVDNGLYKEIRSQRGTLRIDQNLGLHRSTSVFVSTFAKNDAVFSQRFAQAIVKMGSIGVLTGDAGEIRTSCRVFNN